ncbi:MAG: hypothetical protein ACYDHW_06895 [Syntrophorhabdaceae bacterium]
MAKRESLFDKVKNAPANVRITKLCKLMRDYKFKVDKSNEGFYFTHPLLRDIEILRAPKPHKPNGASFVKQPYVDKCIKAIEILIELEEPRGGSK